MRIYFIGVCGTAIGNVAILIKRLGHDVAGSDTGMYEPMKSALHNAGVRAEEGWNPSRIEAFAPDIVVVGNAISRMNPELEFILDGRRYEYTSLPDLIGSKLIGRRKSLVICGTHGKTTTTSIAAGLLRANGLNAGWLIGGIPKNLSEGGANLGDLNAPFVIEGDEYDTAFFDKRSKFLHYRPHTLLINNLEFDHADIFRDLVDVKRTFTHVRRIVPPRGCIVENSDDANIADLEPTPWTRRFSVGFGKSAFLRISDFAENLGGSEFALSCGKKNIRIKWGLHGVFNARNAAMAAAGAANVLELENPLDLDLSFLENFGGVMRRQELILDTPRIAAYEDFGHHPTAIRLTLESLKTRYPDRKLIACFEPRSNTAKRKVLQKEFADSLSLADMAYIGFADTSKVPADMRMDTAAIAAENPEKTLAFNSNEELLEKLESDARSMPEKLVCVFFSNGSFGSIHTKFAKDFA